MGEQDIQNCMTQYLTFKVNLFEVDSLGNVYINPDGMETPHKLIRTYTGEIIPPQMINSYEEYKNGWYIRKTKK